MPCVDLNAVPMSLPHSSVSMLFTERSRAQGAEAPVVAGGERRGHVPAVAAAEHADPIAVAERVPVERAVDDREHVVDVDTAPARASLDGLVLAARDRLPPPRVATAAATRVAHHDDEAGRRLHLGLVEERLAVLRERATVDVEQDRVLAAGLEAGRTHDPRVDLVRAVRGRDAEPLPPEPRAGDVGDGPVQRDDLGRVLDRRLGRGDPPAGGIEPGDAQRASGQRLRRRRGGDPDPVQVRLTAILGRGEQGVVVHPDRCTRAGGDGERPVEAFRHPPVGTARHRDDADLGVLRVDQRVVEADERHRRPVRGHRRPAVGAGLLREGDDLAVERDHVEVLGEVDVPPVVAAGRGDDAGAVGEPRRAVVLERTGGQVERRRRCCRHAPRTRATGGRRSSRRCRGG